MRTPCNTCEIMERALDIALDKKDLKRKRARRLDRAAKRRGEAPNNKPRPDEVLARERRKHTTRHIPSEVRERVHERAGYPPANTGVRAGPAVAREQNQVRGP